MQRLLTFRKKFTALLRCESGLAFLEFGLSIGIFLLLFFGTVEVSRYVLIARKVQETANQETNMITSLAAPTITQTEMNSVISAAAIIMSPYTFNTDGYVILTDIYAPGSNSKVKGKPVVKWRYCGGGNLYSASSGKSKFGSIGGAANLSSLPNTSFSMNETDEIVVAEVFYRYTPIVNNNITSMIVPTNYVFYYSSVSVPRTTSLTTLVGPNFASNCI